MTSTAWWIAGLAAVATVAAGAVVVRWQEKRRRTPQQAAEHVAIRALWRLARRMPASQLLRDPVTGQYFLIFRHRMFLEVQVCDINFTDLTDPDLLAGAVVSSYGIGGEGGPMPAPILRKQQPADPKMWTVQTLRQAKALQEFNERTGAMYASLEELLLLHEQLERALREQ